MNKPLLQIALDNLSIDDAINNIEKVKDHVDIIEVGTILLAAEGIRAVKKISMLYPNKIIVADGKIADAGAIFAKMFFDAGANYTTCICAAEISTIEQVNKVAISYNENKETQIELTSNFTWNQAKLWWKSGIKQVVWHRSRDAQSSGQKWSKNDLDSIKKLIDIGFKVTVTGGITIDDIEFFKNLPIHIFIAGRSIRDADDPKQAAYQLKQAINKHYG